MTLSKEDKLLSNHRYESAWRPNTSWILFDWVKRVVSIVIGAPYHDDYRIDFIRATDQFEKVTLFIRSTKYGYRHEVDEFRRKVDSSSQHFNLLANLSTFITLIRLILCQLFQDEPLVTIYLADYFGHYRLSWAIRVYFGLVILVIHTLRVSIRATETHGIYDDSFRTINKLRQNEPITFTKDNIDSNLTESFCFITTLAQNFFTRIIILINIIVVALVVFITINVPAFHQYDSFFWSAIFWFPSVAFMFIGLASYLLTFGGYIISVACVYIFRFRSLVGHCRHLSKTCLGNIDSTLDDSINQLILFFNQVEQFSIGYKGLCFNLFMLLAGISNMTLYAGLVIAPHSPIMSNFLFFLGALPIIELPICSEICAFLIISSRRIYVAVQGLQSKGKLTISQRLKIDELVNRTIGPTVGVQVGDVSIITPLFTLMFLLEFASTFMLQYCNLQTFLE